ncbi:MAG TPA: hypothetical protein VGL40_08460 [Bacillota bacterium]
MVVDTQRAQLVVSRVHRAFGEGRGLLSDTEDLVEHQIPEGVEGLSRDHALFLFYTVPNDHGMKSARLYAAAKRLFRECPRLFEPQSVIGTFVGPDDPDLIESTGQRLGTRYPRETARSWYANSIALLERYGGDPRTLWRSSDDARTLMRNILSFRGYGPKTGGMLLRAVVGLGFSNVKGIEEVLLPVDIHDSRISFLTGIVRLNDPRAVPDYRAYVTQVPKILLAACNALGLEWPDTDRALWLIGSRGCVGQRCARCPLADLCSVGARDVVGYQVGGLFPSSL